MFGTLPWPTIISAVFQSLLQLIVSVPKRDLYDYFSAETYYLLRLSFYFAVSFVLNVFMYFILYHFALFKRLISICCNRRKSTE